VNTGLGMNDERAVPSELRGFGWAAFLWGPVWAVTYRVWVGLFTLVPGLGLIMNLMLGLRGAEWAYRKGAIPDIARFRRAQRNWVIGWLAGAVLIVPIAGIVSATAIYGAKKYITNAKRIEAKNVLGELTKRMGACAARGEVPESSQWVPASAGSVRGMKYQSVASDWSSQAAFACTEFALNAPQYFRYRWVQATTASGQFEAEADLDGDGVVDNAMQQGVHCSAGVCEVEPILGDTPTAP